MQQLLSSRALTRVEATVRESPRGPAQVLHIVSEIALALLAHPVAAASLGGDFSDRPKCSARMRKACRDQQGRGVTWLVRFSCAFF